MTTQNPNPDPTPPPLNEDEMLLWVEGRLSRIDEWKLANTVRRPGVARRVQQMQANRAALQSLADEKAPPELMERVMVALEREALLGLSQGESIGDPIPIARAKPKASSRRLDRYAPGLALAAGLVLLVAGAAYWSTLLFSNQPLKRLAWDTSSEPDLPLTPTPDGTTFAKAPDAATTAIDAMRSAPPVTVAAAEGPREIDAARALELAREGRLAVRVLSRNARSLPQVEAAASVRSTRPWRLSRDVPATVVAAILPVPGSMFVGPPNRDSIGSAAFAAANTARATLNLVTPMIGPGAAVQIPTTPEPLRRVRGTYLADVADSEQAMTVMRSTLADRLDAQVVFEELLEPLEMPQRLDAETLLWWTQPPSSWTRRVMVPLVVEER
jgi:hypothetical protein